MVAAFHAEDGYETDAAHRETALAPLLEGSPHGCVWLIGPRNAPVGYIIVSFGWSVELGGLEGFVDEFFIRPGVRGRGVGTEVLNRLIPQLESNGLCALHMEVLADKPRLLRLYEKAGFRLRDGFVLMTRTARR